MMYIQGLIAGHHPRLLLAVQRPTDVFTNDHMLALVAARTD